MSTATPDANEPQTGAQSLDGPALRRALAFNAVGPALSDHDEWLPLSVRQAVADAVLTTVDTELERLAGDAQWNSLRYEGAEQQIQHLLALLGEAVDWIHDGELRDRIVEALEGRETEDPEKQQLREQVARVRRLAANWRFAHYEGDLNVAWSEAATALLAVIDNPTLTHTELGFDQPATVRHAAPDQPQEEA